MLGFRFIVGLIIGGMLSGGSKDKHEVTIHDRPGDSPYDNPFK